MAQYINSTRRIIPSLNTRPVDLDFLEIGTSNFDTLLQTATEVMRGMSVEPLKHYLDALPNRAHIVKVNAAITSNKITDTTSVYYIPENIIQQHKLQPWLKGCNSINEYHPWHIRLGITQLVKIETVPLLNIDELLKSYNIRQIKFLKIDTEGHDVVILNGLFSYLRGMSKKYYPLKIQFESNQDVPVKDVDAIIQRAIRSSYRLVSRGFDTILELK